MNVTAPEKTSVVPFSLRDAPSLIEKAWPTAKISAETQKERKAVQGQTLTGLGSYWKGRKPLILTRACVLAALMPATDDLERDVEIFEKLMGMADETFGRRYEGGPTAFVKLFPDHALEVADDTGRSWVWRDDLDPRERQRRIARAFIELPYGKRLEKVKRPEELAERDLLDGIWDEVNTHLGTRARSISELVEQLGIMRFGRRPLLADTFSGSGSIPFEAARVGCDVIASDLNPIACMLSWASFNIVGANPKRHAEIVLEMRQITNRVDETITDMGIEHDADGNRAKLYLYCIETRCPRTGWMVPLSPTWMISKKRNTIARLVPDHANKRYEIEILNGVSDEEVKEAETGTLRSGRMFHPMLDDDLGVSVKEIRGDYRGEDGMNANRLRPWGQDDIRPRPDDIFQERLYAIQWMDGKDIKKGKGNPRTWFAAATPKDLAREIEVVQYVERHLAGWQRDGFVPDMKIEPGHNNSQPIRERGWSYWHQLFCPRQILAASLVLQNSQTSPEAQALLARYINWNSKLCHYGTGASRESTAQTFYNQALNTFPNYGVRSYGFARSFLDGVPSNAPAGRHAQIKNKNALDVSDVADIYLTDPPYADAVNYDEITEFFIAWLRKNPPAPFDEWIWDSRRNIAIKGEGQSFKAAMIDAYSAMAEHMSDNGLQIVQFTHQDAKTWSDMAQIFWGAGLQVVQDWYVSTETITELKKGGYVQGTHMIVLKKRQGDQSGYQDEIVHEIRDEVERQIKEMIGLNDKMDAARGENIFNDADLQMAGYAAALRILTAYTKIDGIDMTREALRPRKKGEKTLVDELTEFAVQTANEFLVPEGLERELWLELNGAERFYLKMMDIEEEGEAKLDQFQNFAKAFRVGDYDDMMASKSPNNARLKTAIKLGKTSMAEGTPFGRDSIVRLALRGVWRVAKEDEVDDVLEELRDMIPDYLRKRDTLRQIIAYVAAKREQTEPDEASAARILGTAIQTERI
ncbi:MAG: DNA methylase [Acidobacteria bacterium]|nr:DNA methylase [Acidobacteriota bacterium]